MTRVELRRRVVWSPLLVLAVIGAQVAVISAVGVFAAIPQSSGVNLSLPNPNGPATPTVNGSAVVTFAPAFSPVLGSRSLELVANCPLSGMFAERVVCWSSVQIAGCADPHCQVLNNFAASAFVDVSEPVAMVHLPAYGTTFLISAVGYLVNDSLGVILTWWDTQGFPQGLTALSASFVLATFVGSVAMVAGWVSSKRLGEGWATEYPRIGFPRQ